MPRVVIGSPLFDHADHFAPAIESILSQTFRDFALVLVDDCSTDSTPEAACRYAAQDPRVSYRRNEARVGLTENSRRAFGFARGLHPEAEYFAWASDHDLWHPEWLQELVAALDASPAAVAAYPLNRRIGPSGELLKRKPWVFDTAGIANRWMRVSRAILHMRAGNMVYGLYRVGALQRVGVYRDVLVPDRLLFAELSLYGPFVQVRQVLWFRRWYGRLFSLRRQRASLFPARRPPHAYAPWWIGHAASLFRIYTIRGDGRPEITRAAGALAALLYAVLAGLLHGWQTMRGIRGRMVESGAMLRQRARRLRRAVKPVVIEAARGPYLQMLRLLRTVPPVRKHVIPALLKQELGQIPAMPTVRAVRAELERLQKTDAPLVIGPWVGEVGYELLYWIPFLNWALRTHGLDRRRLIVVSRGGARPWYRHLTSEYVDVFSLFSIDEYRQANEARWDRAGHQKQYRVEQMDLDILDRAKERIGERHAELLHPSLMYRLLRFYWFDKAGTGLLKQHTDYRPFAPMERSAVLKDLPRKYVAVRFYFRPSFPDTPENRRFAADVIGSISREVPVVLLNTGHKPDEHEDLTVSGPSVYRVDDLMSLEQNLEIQTEIVSGATAFVGTYGGLAYLGPFYGVPSISFYSTESELVAAHLDVSWQVGRTFGVRSAVLHTRLEPLLRVLLRAAS
jgi:glycosyltransferase involved in cell wall biosynthesis